MSMLNGKPFGVDSDPSVTPIYSDWDTYKFGLWVGLRTLTTSPVDAIKRLINPVEYIRCVEFRYVLEHLEVHSGDSVLDIGSPKLLSLFLADRMAANIHATDLVDYFFSSYAIYADKVLGQHRDRYSIETQDARALSYADESIDRVFSVSVIEHIPDDGDSAAMREINRVLKPGGVCCLTMPWCDRGYLEEFAESGGGFYWMAPGQERVFYQRAYDRPSLDARVIQPSGLEVVDLSFWGEERIAVEDMMTALPAKVLKWSLLPAHFYLNRLFLSKLSQDQPSKKKVVCLTLRKPDTTQLFPPYSVRKPALSGARV